MLWAWVVLVAFAQGMNAERAEVVPVPVANQATIPKGDIADVDLNDLLDVNVQVASTRARRYRDAPGIVTVITREEILRSGARDLVDVLRRVPGFQLGVDVQGAVGLGFRGNWGQEGKIAVLLDGHGLNELAYGTFVVGNRVGLDQVQRIEIVRGPGSVLYGGFAELAVINIVTRRGTDQPGVQVSGQYGQTRAGYARRNAALSVGYESPAKDLDVALHLFAGQGRRSDRVYTDVYGDSYDMLQSSQLDPLSINLSLAAGGLEVHAFFERYAMTQRDAFDAALPAATAQTFTAGFVDAKYRLALGGRVTLTPRASYTVQQPWRVLAVPPSAAEAFYDTTVHRTTLSLALDVALTPWLRLDAGVGGYYDDAWGSYDDGTPAYASGVARFFNGNVLGELQAETPWANLSLGGRFDYHSQFGPSAVPRLAVTRSFGDVAHVKALVSQAFRYPSLENVVLEPAIEPERTTVLELELGVRPTPWLLVAANLFDVNIGRPIVYFYDEGADEEGYVNRPRTGTSGAEVEVRLSYQQHFATLTYSFYTPNAYFFAGRRNLVPDYHAGPRAHLLGFSPHKITLASSFNLWRDLFLGVTGSVLPERYAYTSVDAEGVSRLARLDPEVLLNVVVRYEGLGLDELDVSLGVYDVLGSQAVFPQPYDGYHAPLPGLSREFLLRVAYRFGDPSA